MATHLKFFFSNRLVVTVGLVFASNSFMFGNWVTRIPDVKDALGLSEAELGLALLGAPIGALFIMPISGWVISKLGLGKTVVLSALVHSLSLPVLSLAGSFWQLVGALCFFGFSNALMDISMNASAAITERNLKKAIMSTCHGMWSFGAMLGSALGSVVVGSSSNTILHLSFAGGFIFIVLLVLMPTLLPIQEPRQAGDKVFALPKGALLLLALMAFCIMISEGGIADWSAVYMRDVIMANPYYVGFAYAGFSLMMAIGRMAGDAIIPRFGKKSVVVFGGLISGIGLTIALLFSQPILVIIGFSITGIGYSCIVPVLFMSAANEPGYASGTGIAAVTTLGYSGFLIGPPFIGFLGEHYGLTIGMTFILFCSLMVSVVAMAVKFR